MAARRRPWLKVRTPMASSLVVPRGLWPVARSCWFFFHCVESFLPVPRVAGCGPGRPRARARMLLRPRPDRAIRAGAPRCSPPSHETLGRSHRHPGAARPSGTHGRRSTMATRGTGGWTTPPPTCRRSCCGSRLLAKPRVTSSASTRRGGGWPKPPSGRRPISSERAGPERASRGGVSLAPTEGLSEGGEQRGAPPRDVPARSHAQAGRRAALDAPPERHGRSPLGKR